MNINANNQSLINTLLQQATKSSEKKRPTFEEVYAKLNARTSKINANRQPINAMLTNEQLFRYYLKETDPKLQVSNETFSSDELFNPIKETDPTKIYGSGATLTSDIAQLTNPANNLPIIGIPTAEPAGATAGAAGAAAGAAPAPPTPSLYSALSPDQQADIQEAEMFIDSGNDFLEYFNNTDMNAINDESKEFLNVIFAKGVGDGDWSELGQYIFDRLNNRLDEGAVVADLYRVMTAFSAMPDGLTKYHIPRAIFKLTSPPNSYGGIEDYKAILEGSEIDLRKRFYDHRDSNGAGLREADGTYSRRTRAEGERQFAKYSLNKFDPIDAVSTFFIADNQARIDFIKTGKAYESDIGDEGWVNPRLLEVQQNRRLGVTGIAISNMFNEMFNDIATELTTNTDINSTILDDQIVDNFIQRQTPREIIRPPPLKIPTPSISTSSALVADEAGRVSKETSISTEAGSGEVDIDNALMRRPRGRGVQPGDVRGPYEKTRRREAASTLQASVRQTLQQQQQEMRMGAKGGGI
jgi:hypothetical protein